MFLGPLINFPPNFTTPILVVKLQEILIAHIKNVIFLKISFLNVDVVSLIKSFLFYAFANTRIKEPFEASWVFFIHNIYITFVIVFFNILNKNK